MLYLDDFCLYELVPVCSKQIKLIVLIKFFSVTVTFLHVKIFKVVLKLSNPDQRSKAWLFSSLKLRYTDERSKAWLF